VTEPIETPPGPQPVTARGKGLLKLLLRIGVSAAVLALLLAKADVSKVWHTIRSADAVYLVLAVASIFVGLLVSAFRWKAYLDALEMPLRVGTLFRLYFVGTFFNAFLPTGIGGDAYKAVRLGRDKGALASAFASVFLDRFAGFVALGAMGLLTSSIVLISGDARRRIPGVALLLCLGILGAATILLAGGERLLGRGRLVKHEGIGGHLRSAVRSIHQAGRHPSAAARGYLFGFVFQLLVICYHLSIAKALGIKGVPVLVFSSIVVIASLATMLPSINGIGFREGSYIWALGRYGIPHDPAFAFAILVFGLLLLTSLTGGIIYIILGGEVHRPGRAAPTVGSAPTST
jgi:glycosyltransferase 2 family protein